ALILMLFEKTFRYLDAFLIISVIIALEGTIISWAHNKIESFENILMSIVDLPKGAIIETCRKQKADIFNEREMIIFAIIFIIFVHITGIDYHAVSFNTSISFFIFKFLYYIAVYLEGAGLYILIMTAFAVHKIGALPLRVDALYSDFHAIGLLYSKFTICAACVYVIWGFFHIIVPPQFSSLQMILWFVSFAFLLFAYFILPQYSIHNMMRSTKKEKIERLSSQLRAAMDGSFEVPTDRNLSHLKDIFIVQDKLNQMCEWPFGTCELLYITLIIIIPFVIVLLEIALGIIK
ncbi:MAG: hypothetical protein WBN94_08390, partial [Methanothrix sp.]